MTETQGRLLGGRYRLLAPLGRGGMAVVWRATDEMLGREVAIKTLDLTGPDSDNAGERFRREARATAALNHPHIVTVYDTGVEDDTAYLVMELLPGPTLAEQVRDSGPLPVEEVRTIGIEVAGALQAAHDAGIVHRDIKPGNISYAADGTVKVLDFGITQIVDEALGHQAQLTMTNTIVGTAEYLAPEQATGQRVDSRADLYALGCVLTTLLTGEPPFTGPTPVSILMKQANDPAPDVREKRPDTPADMADLVTALLAKDPANRPQSGRDVAGLLRSHRAPAVTEVLAPATAATRRMPAGAGVAGGAAGAYPSRSDLRDEPYDDGRDDRYGALDDRRGSKAWVWFLLLAAALAAAGIWYVLGNQDDTDTPNPASSSPTVATSAPTPTVEETTPSEEPTSSTPAPTETVRETVTSTPTSTTPAPPGDGGAGAVTNAVSGMSGALREAQQNEEIDGDIAKTIDGKLKDIEKALRDGDADAVRSLTGDIEGELRQAQEQGELTPQGGERLSGPVQDLRAAADAYQP
ncbi:serine/threonine-protein kinase [Knoellia remsis]|uniref:non-specific serine/threonine protein kinase n=1 Tax=Knoellia remsis TaxID=407159 RepID=A0A2T0UAN7_9MICO|nr:protein kinase [Knoellia remsis]PRY54887.1 serine/threonine-protein kinase [Knoellia remsis]